MRSKNMQINFSSQNATYFFYMDVRENKRFCSSFSTSNLKSETFKSNTPNVPNKVCSEKSFLHTLAIKHLEFYAFFRENFANFMSLFDAQD